MSQAFQETVTTLPNLACACHTLLVYILFKNFQTLSSDAVLRQAQNSIHWVILIISVRVSTDECMKVFKLEFTVHFE